MANDQSQYDPFRDAFSKNYQFITYDHRGAGQSDHPEFIAGDDSVYSAEIFGNDLKAVLDALGIDKAHILGYSMSTVAAISFASNYPERVDRLILASALASRLPESVIERARKIERMLDNDGLDAAYEFYFSGPMFGDRLETDREFREQVERMRARATIHGFKGCYRATMDRPDLLPRLATLKCPTLILVGEKDRHYLAEAKRMENLLPDARRVVLPDTGHAMTVENPVLFTQEILDFLAEQGGCF